MKQFVYALTFFALVAAVSAYHQEYDTPHNSRIYYNSGFAGERVVMLNNYDTHYSYTYSYREPGRCIGSGCGMSGRYGGDYRQRVRYNDVYNRIRGTSCPSFRYTDPRWQY